MPNKSKKTSASAHGSSTPRGVQPFTPRIIDRVSCNVNEKIDVEKKVMNPDNCKARSITSKRFKKLEEKWIEVIRRARSACKEQRPPPGPCVSALRDFVEHPLFVLFSTLFLVVYLVVIAVTGPQPDQADSPMDQKLLMGVSIAGIIVWGFELSLKFVSFGRKLFFLDAWRCLQFVCYLTLVADVCGSSGVAIVYIRAVELMSRFETIANFLVSGVLQLDIHQLLEMNQRMVCSGKCMIHAIFLTLTSTLPILFITLVFVVLLALLGHQLFGSKDADFLRNRCVTDFSSNHAGQVIIHDLLDPSNEAKDGEFSPNKSSCVFMDDGLPVVLVPWALAGQSVVDICTQALLAVAQPEARCSNMTQYGSYGCQRDHNQVCLHLRNIMPFDGLLSFDNAGLATLIVLLVMLQQDVSTLLHATVDSCGNSAVVWFFVITVFGTYILQGYMAALVCSSHAAVQIPISEGENKTNRDSSKGHVIFDQHLIFDQSDLEVATSSGQRGGALLDKNLTKVRNNYDEDPAKLHDFEETRLYDFSGNQTIKKTLQSENHAAGNRPGNSKNDPVSRLKLMGKVSCGFIRPVLSFFQKNLSVFSRRLNFLVVYPNPRDTPEFSATSNQNKSKESQIESLERRFGIVEGNRHVSWLDAVMDLLAIVHAVALSTKRHEMNPQAQLWLESVDRGMVLMFTGVEIIRIIAFGGPIAYVKRGARSQFNFCISAVTFAALLSGSQLQVGAFRVLTSIWILIYLPCMQRSRTLLLIAVGRPVDLTSATLVFICFLYVSSMMGWQLLGKASWTGGIDYFAFFIRSFITIFGVSIGEEMRQLFLDGHKHVGAPAVIFIIISCILLRHIVSSLFMSVFVSNFKISDQDCAEYQIQFEKLSKLWGWTEEQAKNQWMYRSTPHKELLQKDGLISILHPDAAGVFHRIRKSDISQEPKSLRKVYSEIKSFFSFSNLNSVQRLWDIFCCQRCCRVQHVKTYLSVLVLRGRRLNLLDVSTVSPNFFVRVRLERIRPQVDQAGDHDNQERVHTAEFDSEQEVNDNGDNDVAKNDDDALETKKRGLKLEHRKREGNLYCERAADGLRASQNHASEDKSMLKCQTAAVRSWNPEWKEEIFAGPLVQEQGARITHDSLDGVEVLFELWSVPPLSRMARPDILLGSSRQSLSQLSRHDAQMVVLPMKEACQQDECLKCVDTDELSDVRKSRAIDEIGDGACVTARLLFVQSIDDAKHLSAGFFWYSVKSIAKSKLLDRIMLAFVIISTLISFGAQENSDMQDNDEGVWREIIDLIFLAFLVFEVSLKVCTFGAFSYRVGSNEKPYLRSPWHQLDALIALWMVLALIVPVIHDGLSRVYTFRIIRVLRPFLAMSRFSGLRTASMAITSSVFVVFMLLAFTGLMLFAGAVSSVYAFHGKLDYCYGGQVLMHLNKGICSWVIFGKDGIARPLVWEPPQGEHFNEIRSGLVTMFRVLNSNGWARIAHAVLLARNPDTRHPLDSAASAFIRSQNDIKVLPFLLFHIIADMIIVQCVTSMLINALDASRRRAFLTREQRSFDATKRMLHEARDSFVREPAPAGVKRLQHLVHHDVFQFFSTSMIICNIISLLSEHRDASEDHIFITKIADFMFIIWYVIEQGLNLIAFSTYYVAPLRRGKRMVAWMNIFDLVVTALAVVAPLSNIYIFSGINAFRSIRVLRMLERIPSVSSMVQAIAKSFKMILGSFAMLMIITSAYAVIGSAFFNSVKQGNFLNRQSNFNTPADSLVVMVRIIGGEDWPSIMEDLVVEPPLCTESSSGDCGTLWSVPFFISYYIVIQYLFMPLVVASLICTFFETVGQEFIIPAYEVRHFVRIWKKLDLNQTGFIAPWKIRSLLVRLEVGKSILKIDVSSREEQRVYGLIEYLKKSRHESIGSRQQSLSDGFCFMHVGLGLITAHAYPWLFFTQHSPKEISDTVHTCSRFGEKGGVVERWARRRNAEIIRDSLFLQDEEGSFAGAGKLWTIYQGMSHVWVLSAQGLPESSANGTYCSMTLFHANDVSKKQNYADTDSRPEEHPMEKLDEEASAGHVGPLFGWLRMPKFVGDSYAKADNIDYKKRPDDSYEQHMKDGSGALSRGVTFRTRTVRGSRNCDWGRNCDHFAVPIVNSDGLLRFSLTEDSAGQGHKRIFGSAEVSLFSIVQQDEGLLRLPLTREGCQSQVDQNYNPSIAQSQIALRFLYKGHTKEARLGVFAWTHQCIDPAFVQETEQQPSAAAGCPESPRTMNFYKERDFRKTKREGALRPLEVNTSDVSNEVEKPGLFADVRGSRATVLNSLSGVQDSRQVQHVPLFETRDMGTTPSRHVSSAPVGHAMTDVRASKAHEPVATRFSAQLWSYLEGKGKSEKVTVMSRRSRHAQLDAPSLSAHATTVSSPADPGRTSTEFEKTKGFLAVEKIERPTNLPELEKPDEDEDESLPVARPVETGEVPTLSEHATNLLSTPRSRLYPRNAYYRDVLYPGGVVKETVPTDDASIDGSKTSVMSSFSVLREIVQDQRVDFGERLKGLKTTFMQSVPNLALSSHAHNPPPQMPGLSDPSVAKPAPVEESARTIPGAKIAISQELELELHSCKAENTKNNMFVTQEIELPEVSVTNSERSTVPWSWAESGEFESMHGPTLRDHSVQPAAAKQSGRRKENMQSNLANLKATLKEFNEKTKSRNSKGKTKADEDDDGKRDEDPGITVSSRPTTTVAFNAGVL